MAKHQWSILCKRSIIDKDDNSISIIDALEELSVLGKLPQDMVDKNISKAKGQLTSMGLQLVSLWIRSIRDKPENCLARVEVKGPDRKKILALDFNIDLSEKSRFRSKIQFPAIPYGGPGIYSYFVKQNKGSKKKPRWNTVSELFLDLKEIDIGSPAKTH